MSRHHTAVRYACLATAGLVAAGTVTAATAPVLAGVRAVGAAGSWGRATQVPGLTALAAGGDAVVGLVSCPSAGGCAAAGGYQVRSGRTQGFVASQQHGRWGKAIAIPGLRALNKGGNAQVFSLSCASAGNCAVAGGYKDGSGRVQGFVASQWNGRWGKAIEVPGLGALNTGGGAEVLSLSCASAGNCAATGFYIDSSISGQGFVASERNGRWGKAIEIPGLQALNDGGGAAGVSVSCATAGNCAIAGQYSDGGGNGQGFVASERNGRWGKAIDVPGLRALDTAAGDAGVSSVSCASAGNCSAGGFYENGLGPQRGFVASERDGRWGKAIEIPGLRALNPNANAEVNSMSCTSAGNCAAAGDYQYNARHVHHDQGFVVSQRNGRWGKAIDVPGLRLLNAGGSAEVGAVSCASTGNCAAAGDYRDHSDHEQGFVVSERHGRWGKAIEVPGLASQNPHGFTRALAVSCAPASYCTAAGGYLGRSGHGQGFIVSQQHNP